MRQLFPSNTFVSPQVGPSSRLVVAEAPGENEAIEGKPLCGDSGNWFNALYAKAGVKRDDLNIINTIQCRPPNNDYPTDPDARVYISAEDARKSVDHCFKQHVEPMLKARNWNRIDLLGDKALNAVTGKDGIYTWRGSPVSVPVLGNGTVALPTLHPAAIMRDQAMMPVVVNDLRKSLVVPPEKYTLFPDITQVQKFTATEFAFDIETPRAGHAWEKEQIFMVGLSAANCEALVVPFRGAYIDELRRIFSNAKAVVGHNHLQFDLPVLQKFGITVPEACELWDTMLLQHLRFPDLPHDLEFVASQFLSKPAWKDDKAIFELYCARDTDVTWQIYKILKPMVEQAGLMDLYLKVQVPLAKICYEMYKTGFKVDTSQIARVREKLLKEMEILELDLPQEMRTYYVTKRKRFDAPPGTLNPKNRPVKYIYKEYQKAVVPWRSTSEKQKYLYGKDEPWQLGLPVQVDPKKKTVTTGKGAVDKLVKKLKEAADIKSLLAMKRLNQLDETITTFCKEGMIQSGLKRLHPHFNVHGTNTGRLSSSDPNCQNIPESARIIYVPTYPDWELLSVDFSGIENRLQAYFANDQRRLERFKDTEFSEHKYLVSLIEGIPYKDVVKDKDPESSYQKAKHVVHGSDRAMGAKKMSMMYDLDFKEVKRLLAMWKAEIAATVNWQERIANQGKDQGWLANPFGRKAWFYTSSWYTQSISFMPQGTAADVIYRCMIALMYERIGWPAELARKIARHIEPLPQPAQLLIQVHDELVFEYPKPMRQQVIGVVNRVMTQPWPELGGMSLPIGIAVGPSWGEVESYKLEAA